jgi:hypothetical protein
MTWTGRSPPAHERPGPMAPVPGGVAEGHAQSGPGAGAGDGGLSAPGRAPAAGRGLT